MRYTLATIAALGATAFAQPQTFVMSHQGYLIDENDAPVTNASQAITFSIWDDPDSTLETHRVWGPEDCTVDVKLGFYTTALGGGTGAGNCGGSLTTAALPLGQLRYLEVSVGAQRMTPRMRIGAAPTAALAADSERIGGLTLAQLDARYPQASLTALDARYDERYFGADDGAALAAAVSSELGPSATQTLTNKTIDADDNTILNIDDDEIAAGAGIARSKIAAGAGDHVVINDENGALSSLAQLSIGLGGTGASTAAGAFNALSPLGTKGQILVHDGTANSALVPGTNGQVLMADSAAGQGVKWGTFTLPASGEVPQAATPPVTCSSSTGGRLYYDTGLGTLRVCNGASWVALGTSGNAAGQVPETALASCDAIKAAAPNQPSGVLYIDPDGAGGNAPFQVYCLLDTTIAGGGWALAMNLDTSDGNTHPFSDTAFWTTAGAFGSINNPLSADYKAAQVYGARHGQLLIAVHQEGNVLGWRSWPLAASASLAELFNHARSRIPAPLTGPSGNSNVGSLDSREAVVRPNSILYANMIWGAGGSPDWARVRSALLTDSDNQQWGLGMQMDAQNQGGLPCYPGCDAASTTAWDNYFCIGSDRQCGSPCGCGTNSNSTQGLEYDYAFFVAQPAPASAPDPSLLGNSASTAAASCAALKTQRPTAPSGVYYIDPDGVGSGGAAYQVVCEQDIDGGGWTLGLNLDTNDQNTRYYNDTGFWTSANGFGSVGAGLTNDYKSPQIYAASFTQMMIRVHRENLQTIGWRTWSLGSAKSLSTIFSAGQTRSPSAFTSGSTNADTSGIDSREVVVRPTGQLYANMIWGAGGSPDWARIRNSSMPDTDNNNWGLGMQMDAQNQGGNPCYPGCDAGSNQPWDGYFCIGTDRQCGSPCGCGPGTENTEHLHYDYAIYLK
jgi:hypothetical protein